MTTLFFVTMGVMAALFSAWLLIWLMRKAARLVIGLVIVGVALPVLLLGGVALANQRLIREVAALDLQSIDRVGPKGMKFNEFPPLLLDAVQMQEDRDFADRALPIDYRRSLLAIICYAIGRPIGGGSTLQCQTARVLIGRFERTFNRKLLELFLAIKLDRAWTRADTIEAYLNHCTFAGNAIGFRAACAQWYGIDPRYQQVSGPQIYALVRSLRRPAAYRTNEDMRRAARDFFRVLPDHLVESREGYEDRVSRMRFRAPGRPIPELADANGVKASDNGLREEILRTLPLEVRKRVVAESLTVHSTVDPDLQASIQAAASRELAAMQRSHPKFPLEMSVVVMDVATGELRAVVSRDPSREYSFGSMAKRPMASLEKPFIALAAFEAGEASLGSLVLDAPFRGNWPSNFGGKYSGRPVTVEYGLQHSLNTVFARLYSSAATVRELTRIHDACGLPTVAPNDLTQALGNSLEASNVQVAAAYSALGAKGVYRTPILVSGVKDAAGACVYRPTQAVRKIATPHAVLDVLVAMNSAFLGTGKNLPHELRAGGCVKTGTSSGNRSATRDLRCVYLRPERFVCSVWVGSEKGVLWPEAAAGHDLAKLAGAVFLECVKRDKSLSR